MPSAFLTVLPSFFVILSVSEESFKILHVVQDANEIRAQV